MIGQNKRRRMETEMSADAGRAAAEQYFTEMGEIYRSGGGTEETSYYPAFSNLANAVGKDSDKFPKNQTDGR